MARRRPSAFEVSFPDEGPLAPGSLSTPSHRAQANSSGMNSNKRRSDSISALDERAPKQRQIPPVSYYSTKPNEIQETAELIIPGEDPDGDPLEDGQKPIRLLADFSIFDPQHKNEMISLAALEEVDGLDRHFEGAGWVTAYFINDEDAGQEDQDPEPLYVRLGAIIMFFVDYSSETEPFYIETEHAWYVLGRPFKEYETVYKMFYTPRRVTQLIISTALKRPSYSHESFLVRYLNMVDIFGRTCQEEDLGDAAVELQSVVLESQKYRELRSVPLIKSILQKVPIPMHYHLVQAGRSIQRDRQPPNNRALLGNPDLSVLKVENQNTTCVTPRIAALVQGFIREELDVVGPPPQLPNKAQVEVQKQKAHRDLCSLIRKAHKKKNIDWRKADRVAPNSEYIHSVMIDDQIYCIGDYVIVPIDEACHKLPTSESEIPDTKKIPDYFWFARIIYITPGTHTAHVQWLEHGSQILMQELAHPWELFLNNLCGNISLKIIVSKITVHQYHGGRATNDMDYFCKFIHDKKTSAFTSINAKCSEMIMDNIPPDNCCVCALTTQHEQETNASPLYGSDGTLNGIAYRADNFHLDDFVLFKAEEGPANIGYIIDIQVGVTDDTALVTMRQVGRIKSLGDMIPNSMIQDEHHVYLTYDKIKVPIKDLIQVIYVFAYGSIPNLSDWLDLSPDHYYIKYVFPSLHVRSWQDRQAVRSDELNICSICCGEELEQWKQLREFLSHVEHEPMAVLDVFGGVGAFSLGLERGFSGLNVNHTIELSPSAAKTFQHNSPNTIVHNQCANIILRYAIKKQEGHHPGVPKQIYDGRTLVPDPPKPGDIKIIVAGFPCQTHSSLNMFKHANDPKSNLILNALSYVDFYRPVLCYFENVPGFLNYALNATQASMHRLEGGIPMGGLKIVVRALIDMGYQVRFCLLQAGHYGTPQGRVRFFLVAALDGTPLPELPQPTHDFPQTNRLLISLSTGDIIQPIKTTGGTAPHPSVTIHDAISDLPRFDWKHPRPNNLSGAKRREQRERERTIPAFECDQKAPYCGYQGQSVDYFHEPKTRFQLAARQRPTRDLQQYTICLRPKKVERVVSIPLTPNADYRSLAPDLLEWQLANPVSSVARSNYRPDLYGRLDGESYFPTTVTNVNPTAKQSKVLHPYCRRMVTVRELARSQGFPDHFVFKAHKNNVITMHRHIGNAVAFPVATALGRSLRDALFKQWLDDKRNAPHVDNDDDDDMESLFGA
ncbi:hypothetical protein AX17_000310 [Amanita inopinata Kibby_2008]|nr:hypothetical protein AX17_000310 [Amanita inopinata Kibby_2008]